MTKIDIHTQSFLNKIVKPFYVYLERLELYATLKVIVTLFHSPLKITNKNYDNIIERERERERDHKQNCKGSKFTQSQFLSLNL